MFAYFQTRDYILFSLFIKQKRAQQQMENNLPPEKECGMFPFSYQNRSPSIIECESRTRRTKLDRKLRAECIIELKLDSTKMVNGIKEN